MSGPSDKAVEALARARDERDFRAFAEEFGEKHAMYARGNWANSAEDYRVEERKKARRDLEVAHDPALGLDRSVCASDVWQWLRDQGRMLHESNLLARFEREFGGES